MSKTLNVPHYKDYVMTKTEMAITAAINANVKNVTLDFTTSSVMFEEIHTALRDLGYNILCDSTNKSITLIIEPFELSHEKSVKK